MCEVWFVYICVCANAWSVYICVYTYMCVRVGIVLSVYAIHECGDYYGRVCVCVNELYICVYVKWWSWFICI